MRHQSGASHLGHVSRSGPYTHFLVVCFCAFGLRLRRRISSLSPGIMIPLSKTLFVKRRDPVSLLKTSFSFFLFSARSFCERPCLQLLKWCVKNDWGFLEMSVNTIFSSGTRWHQSSTWKTQRRGKRRRIEGGNMLRFLLRCIIDPLIDPFRALKENIQSFHCKNQVLSH